MDEDMFRWYEVKVGLNRQRKDVYFKEREIWWCFLGINVGYEENGKGKLFQRPVLIIKKFNRNLFLALPLSSKIKHYNKYYFPTWFSGKQSSVILYQLRALDKNRLNRKFAKLDISTFETLKQRLSIVISKKADPISGVLGARRRL